MGYSPVYYQEGKFASASLGTSKELSVDNTWVEIVSVNLDVSPGVDSVSIASAAHIVQNQGTGFNARVKRDGVVIETGGSTTVPTLGGLVLMLGAFAGYALLDFPPPGLHTYSVEMTFEGSTGSTTVDSFHLFVEERVS